MNTMNEFMCSSINIVLSQPGDSNPRGLKQKEWKAASLELSNPRNRVFKHSVRSTNLYYAFGELLWYLSGSNSLDHISYYAPSIAQYSDDGKTLNSAYGYLIFKKFGDQFKQVKQIFQKDPDSRQAIILLRSPNDLFIKTKDQVCTCSLQFLLRNNKLDLIVYMRSNDLMVGTIFDVFCFTMLQEIMACELQVNLGTYYHMAGSLHIYEKWYKKSERIIKEPLFNFGFEMPKMNFIKNPMEEIIIISQYEMAIRLCENIQLFQSILNNIIESKSITEYWKDVLLFLATKKARLLDEPILLDELYDTIISPYLKEAINESN